MRSLRIVLFSLGFALGACGDDGDSDRSNLDPGEACTSNDQCASGSCVDDVCVGTGTGNPDGGATIGDADVGDDNDAGTGGTSDAGATGDAAGSSYDAAG